MTIGLAMIVKDEADCIADALRQTFDVVDHVTLVDTGSSDGTKERAIAALTGEKPFCITDSTWRGFGPNRTEALDLARQFSDYVLMLDADHTLHVEGDRPRLDADSYMIRIRGSQEWRLPLLTKSSVKFEYRGVAHSYLATDAQIVERDLDWLSIDGGGGVTCEKLERDRVLLEAAFLVDPEDARTVFYLAQTYRDLDLSALAIQFYRMRAHMQGWDEETYWARFQLGCLLGENVSYDAGAAELLKAWRFRPQRAEALRALANLSNSVADKMSKPNDRLFVRPAAYGREKP